MMYAANGLIAFTDDAMVVPKGGSQAKLFSSYSQRFNQTPNSTGTWLGEREESAFMPNDSVAKNIIEEVGLDGIKYENAIPDFSPMSKAEFQIEVMTSNRTANFVKADEILAKQWGMTKKEVAA